MKQCAAGKLQRAATAAASLERVRAADLHRALLGLHRQVDRDVELAVVVRRGAHREAALDGVALVERERLLEIEDRLLPATKRRAQD